jgi:hypothetical protein
MALYNIYEQVYAPNFNVWARPITVSPLVSQPGAPAFSNRGYFDEKQLDVLGEAGTIFSDAQMYLHILEAEFPTMLKQGDQIDMPAHQGVKGASFIVLDLTPGNAGGLVILTLRFISTNRPATP